MSEGIQSGALSSAFNSISLTDGVLRPVEVSNLESELAALWHAAAKTAESGHAVTRASVLTLLAYVESESAGTETLNLVAEIMHRNPCRAIVMIADLDAKPEGMTASVSACCRLAPGGGRQLCCEQIAVRAHGAAVHGLDSVVVPLAIPGLPVYLWWRARRFSKPDFLRDIFRRTDRLMFDSALFADAETGLKDLARTIDQFSSQRPVAFSDLNWSRLTNWRELIAKSFDAPEGFRHLQEVEEVKIEWSVAGDETARQARAARALLLVAWLAGRLGWKPSASSRREHGVREIFFDARARTARAELRRRLATEGKSAPFSVRIICGARSPASYSFLESADGNKITARFEAAGHPAVERTVPMPPMSEVRLIHEEIRHSSRDVIYEEALGVVARLGTL